MKTLESPLVFSCQSNDLIGVMHQPEKPLNIGVLIVVGGPQYRVGSHRQFVLLARMLADNGISVMRFDYRGMGDSTGQARDFSGVDEDIKAALNIFYQQCPGLEGVVIWGLCDAASAASFYGYQDERVKGLILLNPWVFTEQGAAKTYLKHYYLQRVIDPDLWRKVFTFQFVYRQSFFSLLTMLKTLYKPNAEQAVNKSSGVVTLVDSSLPLPVRMRECLSRYKYPVLFVLSGRDLTADEFREALKTDEIWLEMMQEARISCVELAEVDHTFSSSQWRDEVAQLTLEWVNQIH